MNTRMLHPKPNPTLEKMEIPKGEGETLGELKRALALNRETQEKLKACRDAIHNRMTQIDQFISSYSLKSKFPPHNALLSYIKFERNVLPAFRDQQRISAQPTEAKSKGVEDTEFMRKLNQAKTYKKKKDLNLEELPADPTEIDFLEIHKGTQFKSGLDAYRAWVDFRHVKEPKRLFTLDQDRLIANLHQMYGENWEKISPHLGNRHFDEIFYEYHNRINPNLATGRWTIRQTLMLIILLEHFGAKHWGLIAEKMRVKSELQVRERFCNLVDPSIGKDVWTYELEKRLLEIAEDYGYCWKRISQEPIFRNKTDNCIWRKYKLLMIRFSEEQILEMLPPEKEKINRGLAEKIIKEKRIVEKRKRSAKNKPQPPIYYKHYRPKEPSTTPTPTITATATVNTMLTPNRIDLHSRHPTAVPRLMHEPEYVEQMEGEVHFLDDNNSDQSIYREE